MSLISRRGKAAQLYLGDAAYWRRKIAQQMDGWTLEMPKKKPLGIWNVPADEQVPVWPKLTSDWGLAKMKQVMERVKE